MLTIEIFTHGFKKMRLSFEFPPDIEYQMLIFDVLKNKMNNQMFIDSIKSILKIPPPRARMLFVKESVSSKN